MYTELRQEGTALAAPTSGGTPVLSQQLLLSIAEELKLPLLQIARQAELGQLHGQAELPLIRTTAESALQLLDNYAMAVRLKLEPGQFTIESVSISSVLYDAGQQLDALAKAYDVKLQLNIGGKFGPVQAHRQGLQAALVSLGAALIEALPAQSDQPQLKLELAAHRSRYGIVAGVYSDIRQPSQEALQRGRELQRRSRQPMLGFSHTSAAGIFVADAILNAMQLSLKHSRHHGLYGLGAVLQPNYQLQLV
ncbi:MAG TPA: hypothetical protein VG604_02055 [Candidatus Saccharimonadales bacterium]|nr:hypothetical protein [Candidatus Saccharimonadales bacterium]